MLYSSESFEGDGVMEAWEILRPILPLLIPLFLIDLGLLIAALIHIFKHNTYKVGNRLLWVVVVLLVNIIGPLLYFILGKSDE